MKHKKEAKPEDEGEQGSELHSEEGETENVNS